MAFPDDWLDDLGLADSVKYRMCGNSVVVNVVEWLARRIIASSSHPH
jgi:site-specific DNA-cytosine methylase